MKGMPSGGFEQSRRGSRRPGPAAPPDESGDPGGGARVLLHVIPIHRRFRLHPPAPGASDAPGAPDAAALRRHATLAPGRPGSAGARPFARALLAGLGLLLALGACGDAGGYEIADAPRLQLAAVAPPAASDTVPTIVRAVGPGPYRCARLVSGTEAELRRDTLVVRQSADERRAPFCIPFNLPVRTEGIEATARRYPAEPHGDLPGYRGWRPVSPPRSES